MSRKILLRKAMTICVLTVLGAAPFSTGVYARGGGGAHFGEGHFGGDRGGAHMGQFGGFHNGHEHGEFRHRFGGYGNFDCAYPYGSRYPYCD
jgi:hypothetical protein